MPDKPIVFFSHATEDGPVLELLKNKILEKTGNSIDIFLSSDGQSIPFGRNWVHTLQVALERTQLLFVFLSPAAIYSRWMHFESGFVYSMDKEVVPVGILGQDLTDLEGPLSLLQGFNIRNEEGMNNLITLINQQFSYSFPEDFSEADYVATFQGNNSGNALRNKLLHSVSVIFRAYCQTLYDSRDGGDGKDIIPDFWEVAQATMQEMQVEFGQDRSVLMAPGFLLKQLRHYGNTYSLTLDPSFFETYRNLIVQLIDKAYAGTAEYYYLALRFSKGWEIEDNLFRIAGMVHLDGVKVHSEMARYFEYKNILFTVQSQREFGEAPPALLIYFQPEELANIPLDELLELLVRREVIRPASLRLAPDTQKA